MSGSVMNSTTTMIVTSQPFSSFDRAGVLVIISTAGASLLSVIILAGLLVMTRLKQRSSASGHFFVRTHAGVYFSCLLLGDTIQAIGTLMSARWVANGGVTLDGFCSAQGAIKNAGNLSVSLWSLMLAIHAFKVLYLRWKPKEWMLYLGLLSVWLIVGLVVVLGPGGFQRADRGPYYGISGYWCWIADPYPAERVVLEYLWMYGSAFISFILYTLTFLRLRGNIYVKDGKFRFRRIDSQSAWDTQSDRDSMDIQLTSVARGMIGFPVLFTILVLPIGICRFIAWSGKPVAFEATIFTDAVFSLTGVFDLILFLTTRSLMPNADMLPWWIYPRKTVTPEVAEYGVQPYHVKDFASAHGFNGDMSQVRDDPARVSQLSYNRAKSLEVPDYGRSKRSFEEGGRRDSLSPAAWDEVDLKSPYRISRFTLSAYQHDHSPTQEEIPPLPIPAGRGVDWTGSQRTYNYHDKQSLNNFFTRT